MNKDINRPLSPALSESLHIPNGLDPPTDDQPPFHNAKYYIDDDMSIFRVGPQPAIQRALPYFAG